MVRSPAARFGFAISVARDELAPIRATSEVTEIELGRHSDPW
jgi:hypothetical protein